jgi:hypothetical protein
MTIATCAHRWNIAPPKGPTSRGRCRKCGEQRDFGNSQNLTMAQITRLKAAAAGLAPSSELEA